MTYGEIKKTIVWKIRWVLGLIKAAGAALKQRAIAGIEYVRKFDKKNSDDMESLKWDCAKGVGIISGTASALSLVETKIASLLGESMYGVLIASTILLFLWFLEAMRNRITIP